MSSQKNIRKYMKLAIKEMIKSRSEHKNKFDPMVGTILVNTKGKEIGKAHRGGLREDSPGTAGEDGDLLKSDS